MTNEDQGLIADYGTQAINYTNAFHLCSTLNNLNITTIEAENCKILEIHQCPSDNDASIFISKPTTRDTIFKKFKNLIAIKFYFLTEITDFNFNDIVFSKRSEFEKIHKILLLFESADQSKNVILWKNSINEKFLILTLDAKFPVSLKSFVSKFIIDSLNLNRKVTFNSAFKNLTDLVDSRGFNLLMVAVEYGNEEIVNELLRLPFLINYKTENQKNKKELRKAAIDIAWEKKNQPILYKLLKVNSIFPQNNFDEQQCDNNIQEFVKTCEEMHEAVKKSDETKIKEILDKNKKIRHFFNKHNQSAPAIAITNTEIYKLLIDNKCCVSQHEMTQSMISNINAFIEKIVYDKENLTESIDKHKTGLELIHQKHFQKLSDLHIYIHLLNSVVGHDEDFPEERLKFIEAAYVRVNKIDEGKLLLQINAVGESVTNHFDFYRNHLQHMVPTVDDSTNGLFSPMNKIYVAAEDLLKKDTQSKVDGVILHENGHCSMFRIFRNNCNPYGIDDEINERKFHEIIKECQEKVREIKQKGEKPEEIIESVFECYNEEDYAAELIVRVPHIFAHYQDNSGKIGELKNTFKNLFAYYEDVVMVEMNNALPVLKQIDNNQITFNALTKSLRDALRFSWVDFQGEKVRIERIANEDIFKQLESQQIKDIFDRKAVIGAQIVKACKFYVERNFIDYDFNDGTNQNEISIWMKHNSKDLNSIIEDVNQSKLFLLSDHAGAGKSTTMMHLFYTIKKRMKNYYVRFIDLKNYLKIFKEFQDKIIDVIQYEPDDENVTKSEVTNVNNNFENQSNENTSNIDNFKIIKKINVKKIPEEQQKEQKSLILQIFLELLKPINKLEASIFEYLFEKGQIIFLYDALDEIAPKYKDFFIKLIRNIKELTNNQQWLATRPQHTEELKTKFQHKAYKLMPLDERKTEEFILTFLKNEGINDENDLVNKMTEIKEIITKLKFIDNPQMLKMLVELHIKDKLKHESYNKFILYETMREMKEEEFLNIPGVNSLDSNFNAKISPSEIHQVYALGTIFENKKFDNFLYPSSDDHEQKISFENMKLFKTWKENKKGYSVDKIGRYGFMTITHFGTQNEHSEFVHRTFAEYFVAIYIIEIITEAIQANNFDNLSQTEFEMRMKLACFLINDYCEDSDRDPGIYEFILGYMEHIKNYSDIKLGEIFLKFLIEGNFEYFINKMLKYCKSTQRSKLSKIFLSFFKFQQLRNEICVERLALISNERSELFQYFFTKPNMARECIELFEVFNDLNITSCYKFAEYRKKFRSLGINNIDRYPNQNFTINEKKDSMMINQLISFFANTNDICFDQGENFLLNFVKEFSILFLKSPSMIETLFKIAESYFKNNKQKFALIAEELIKSMCHDVRKFIELDKNLDFVEHVNEFFIKLMKFLNSKVDFQNNLSQKINRIYQNVSDQNNELNVNEKLNNFQIMFVFCDDFEKIVETMKFLEEKYGHNDWVDKTGYAKKMKI